MEELAGKTAIVTGGASGIGLALGRAFAEAGMKVVLADIEANALAVAVEDLRRSGSNVLGVECDVTDSASVERAAEKSEDAFGKLHVLCNNAGVAGPGGIEDISLETWKWVIDVNVMGVLHGIRSFLPRMRAHGEGGHIVNTASMGGLNSGLGFHPYSASKFAVVNMSEGLTKQLGPLGVGVTVVCPGFVRTRIPESARNRQPRYGGSAVLSTSPSSQSGQLAAHLAELNRLGLEPMNVAAQVLNAIRRDKFYVFTHPDGTWRAEVQERFDTFLAAMDEAAAQGLK